MTGLVIIRDDVAEPFQLSPLILHSWRKLHCAPNLHPPGDLNCLQSGRNPARGDGPTVTQPGRRVLVGWTGPGDVTELAGQGSMQSLPRDLSLSPDRRLIQRFVPELQSLRRLHQSARGAWRLTVISPLRPPPPLSHLRACKPAPSERAREPHPNNKICFTGIPPPSTPLRSPPLPSTDSAEGSTEAGAVRVARLTG
eukprot:1182344-Prorocentrum_minimum.AAC.2